MTTEVQIRKHRRYLPHIRKIVACIAAKLGFSRLDLDETEEAVEAVCAGSMDRAEGIDDSLLIRLDAHDQCLTVEITDPCIDFDPLCSSPLGAEGFLSLGVPSALRFTDGVELIRGDEGTTIRLTKYANKLRPPCEVEAEVVQSRVSSASLQA